MSTIRSFFADKPRLSGAKPGMIRPGLLIALLFAVIAAPATPALADTGVRLHDVAGAVGPEVTLADVAELEGDRGKALAAVVVGRFADGRDRVVVEASAVRGAMNDAGVNWAMVSLSGFQRCRVQRIKNAENADDVETVDADPTAVASNLDAELSVDTATSLRRRVERRIAEASGAPRDELRIDFRPRDAERLHRSTLTARFEITPQTSTGLGRVPVQVVELDGDRPVDRFTVAATVSRRFEAVVATQTIDRGDRFTRGRVETREVYLQQAPENPLDDVALVLDQVAASRLTEGDVVMPDHVTAETLVKRGEMITVRAIAGQVVVRTVARATEDGVLDQRIRLRHDRSRETFTAVVVGRRSCVLRVDGSAASASAHAGSPPSSPTPR